MEKKRSVSISERLYNEIGEYCWLNNLKINIFVEELIRKSFNIEKFGEAPFSKMEDIRPAEEPPKPVVDEYIKELEVVQKFSEKVHEGMKTAEKQMEEVVETTPNIQEVQEAVDNIVFDEKPAPEEKPKKRKITRLN